MKISEFTVRPEDFGRFGQGLVRPECVNVESDAIWVSDARGGLAKVPQSGGPTLLGSGIATPNGFSRRSDGTFLVAGLEDGAIHIVRADGVTSVLLSAIDGAPIGAVNYPCVDGDRAWISVMTTDHPWDEALRGPATGQIILLDPRGARIVAEGLHVTNEVKVSPNGDYLYAAESLRRRIIRFPIHSDGSLGDKETVGPEDLGEGAFPDGITFDSDGNIWVTVIVRNGIYVITVGGDLHIVYEDVQQKPLDELMAAVEEHRATPELMGACVGHGPLRLPTSLAFGGTDGHKAYVGSLAADHLVTFHSPTAGLSGPSPIARQFTEELINKDYLNSLICTR
jgi:sugar lactone lactonase YvrE